jgi:hypothetical protein
MSFVHQELAAGRWHTLSFSEQMSNIGSEVERAIKWRSKNEGISRRAAERGLELLWLTIDDPGNRKRLRELTRVYEMLADYFWFKNNYSSTDDQWRRYFGAFTWAARVIKLQKKD